MVRTVPPTRPLSIPITHSKREFPDRLPTPSGNSRIDDPLQAGIPGSIDRSQDTRVVHCFALAAFLVLVIFSDAGVPTPLMKRVLQVAG
jgi:hypothetical protein